MCISMFEETPMQDKENYRWFSAILSILSFTFLSGSPVYAQEGDPRHPAVVHFEEIGRLSKTLYPLGDVNQDGIADGVTAFPLDTCLSPSRCAQELRIHYGVKGRLPKLEEGVRLAPDYLMSKTEIRAIGDWDGKNGLDICVYAAFYGDTAFGNANGMYDGTGVMLIFWNDGTGNFSETSRLYPPSPGSFSALGATFDADNDGIEDLCLWNGSGKSREDTGIARIPKLMIFKGKAASAWNKDENFPGWYWWNAPDDVDRMYARDLDHDGAEDLILSANESNSPLVVLYGRKDGNIPDTIADKQQITINGLESNFSDVTGDNYADLIILNSAQDFVYCYVSTPSARRLQEMFGTGNDPPRDGEWWSRPWATLKGPHLVNEFWPGLDYNLFPLGSADTSAPDEIWVKAWPYILVYRTGMRLDSIFDAEIDLRVAGGTPVRLGDIDGDGRDELAMSGGTAVFRLPDALPSTVGRIRRVPDGTDVPDTISGVEEQEGEEDNLLGLAVHPNPSSGEVVVEWRSRESVRRGGESRKVVLRITDILGQEVLSTEVPVQQDRYVWDASKTFGGRYFISVTINGVSQTTQVSIQQ